MHISYARLPELKFYFRDEVRDVDILVALLEKPEDGFAGKTFACILVSLTGWMFTFVSKVIMRSNGAYLS